MIQMQSSDTPTSQCNLKKLNHLFFGASILFKWSITGFSVIVSQRSNMEIKKSTTAWINVCSYSDEYVESLKTETVLKKSSDIPTLYERCLMRSLNI